jgi:outer membrane protein OmpA-like peptidoglycan-associated protein
MKPVTFLFSIAFAGLIAGCAASVPPPELINARQAYERASADPVARLVPAEVHKAREALLIAEKSFQDDPNSFRTRDLAYVADRKAKLAEALAATASENATTAKANKDYQATQTEIVKNAKDSLATSERNNALKGEQLAAEQKGRLDAEQKAANAQADLVRLAAVKEEARGLVITLSGSVLFASDKSELLPAAQDRLNQVAVALLATKDRKLTVEGHTDSRGSASYNQVLSQARADAVRAYLISRDYPADLIQAKGIGKDRPVADNTSAEGRANNRRVEIIVDHPVKQ